MIVSHTLWWMYRKISNTIRTLVQYAPQTFTRELWENVGLAVQYAPVLCHPSSSPSMPSATSTKGVSCMAQIFSDCAITKYLSRATARRPCGHQTIAAVESLYSCYCIATSTHSSPAELPWTSRNTGRPPTVASPVAHDRRLTRRPVSRHLQTTVPVNAMLSKENEKDQ